MKCINAMNIQINKILPKEPYQVMIGRVNGTIIAPMQQFKHFCDGLICIKRSKKSLNSGALI